MEQILIEDNPHWFNSNAYDRFVNRDILDTALNFLKTKHIIALVGARRVGKSTLAKLMIRELIIGGKVVQEFVIPEEFWGEPTDPATMAR